MSLNKPKNLVPVAHFFANTVTAFALIAQILYPIGVTHAENGENPANINENTANEAENATPKEPEVKPDRVVKAVITAYTSTPDQTDDSPFIAATGKRVYDGMIAVNNLPFGTKIKIPALYGDKVFTVDDRMNRRYTCKTEHCRMDIWLDTTKKEAMKFGVKRVEAEIYYPTKTVAAAKK